MYEGNETSLKWWWCVEKCELDHETNFIKMLDNKCI